MGSQAQGGNAQVPNSPLTARNLVQEKQKLLLINGCYIFLIQCSVKVCAGITNCCSLRGQKAVVKKKWRCWSALNWCLQKSVFVIKWTSFQQWKSISTLIDDTGSIMLFFIHEWNMEWPGGRFWTEVCEHSQKWLDCNTSCWFCWLLPKKKKEEKRWIQASVPTNTV